MRVLVTGGHGFIGRHLVAHLLAQGHSVRCLFRRPGRPPALADLDVEVVEGDVASGRGLETAVRGANRVFHLAGLTRSRSAAEMRRTNAGGTAALFGAARRTGECERFIFCSSQAASGPSLSGEPLSEALAMGRPLSAYGRSKREAEEWLLRQPRPEVVVLRPPAVYGPGDRDFLSLFRGVARGHVLLPVPADSRLSLVFALDLAEAFLAAASSSSTPGRLFFVAHPEVLTLAGVVERAAEALGREVPHMHVVPPSALRITGRVVDVLVSLHGRPALLSSERLSELGSRHWVCATDSFREATGWQAKTPARAGFAATAAWYRDRGLLRERNR